MIFAGIDVGSLTSKCVLLEETGNIISSSVRLVGAQSRMAAEKVLNESLGKAGLQTKDIGYMVSTGYGRAIVPGSDADITEITCHARGANFLNREIRTVIDIGGQDSKAISVSEKGKVLAFITNDKCAAGSGRFLEVNAHALEIRLEDMGELSLKSTKKLEVSSMCTVFAESEVVGLVAAEESVPDIVAGIHRSIARRVVNMVMRIALREKVMMTGGVAKNIGVVKALEESLGVSLVIPDDPQLVGAIGAAVLALEHCLGSNKMQTNDQTKRL